MNEIKHAVICVDDDEMILQMLNFQLCKIMDTTNTLVEFFLDPALALHVIDDLVSQNIEVIFIIVDFQMPNLNGAQLIRALKEKHQELLFIMLSGQANAAQIEELFQEKLLHSFIHKPWSEATLREAIIPIFTRKKLQNIIQATDE
jgi:FixJ family two-component response regulator